MANAPTLSSPDPHLANFILLFRNQRKKKALADTKEAYSKLLADNTALVQQLQAAQRDNYQVTEHFRREVLAKNDRISTLQTQLDQVGCFRGSSSAATGIAHANRTPRTRFMWSWLQPAALLVTCGFVCGSNSS